MMWEDSPEVLEAEWPLVADMVAQYAPPSKVGMPLSAGEWGYSVDSVGRSRRGRSSHVASPTVLSFIRDYQ